MENLNAEQIKYCLELILKSGMGMSRDDVDVTDIRRALALINLQEQKIKELTEENERLKDLEPITIMLLNSIDKMLDEVKGFNKSTSNSLEIALIAAFKYFGKEELLREKK